MARLSPDLAGGENVCAFLDMIAISEHTKSLLDVSDDGYNVIVGSTPQKPILFTSYADHPHAMKSITLKNGKIIQSSAAGRYQILGRYWNIYKQRLALDSFEPENQDRVAIQQLKETHAYPLVISGMLDDAIVHCCNIWASLPGAGYGQHENEFALLQSFYLGAGGKLA